MLEYFPELGLDGSIRRGSMGLFDTLLSTNNKVQWSTVPLDSESLSGSVVNVGRERVGERREKDQ